MFTRFRRRPPADLTPTPAVSPSPYRDLVDPRILDQIGHLELLSRSVVDGLLAGKHRSTTKGGCCEFAQHRQYAAGDEVRQIDWQVYARNDRYFIRQFEEETNLHAMLAIDASGSMKFGLSTQSKLDYSKQAAACLARLLLHQRDAVGLTILHDNNPAFVPAKQHAAHLRAILATLQSAQPSEAAPNNEGSLGKQIQHCAARQRRWSAFQSLEVSGQRIHLDPPTVRHQYLERMRRFVAELEETVVGLGGDYVRLTTAVDLADTLGWFLRNRMARKGAKRR